MNEDIRPKDCQVSVFSVIYNVKDCNFKTLCELLRKTESFFKQQVYHRVVWKVCDYIFKDLFLVSRSLKFGF